MTAEDQPEPADPSFGARTGAAADRLRESARWLVLTSGAVAAVVFAGVGLSRFGELDVDTEAAQFWWAVTGAAVALLGALGALVTTMSLAAASTVTLRDLMSAPDWRRRALRSARDVVAVDPLLSRWRQPGVEDDEVLRRFGTAVADGNSSYHRELEAWRNDGSLHADTTFLDRASTRLQVLQQVQTSVLETASLARLQARFRSARWLLAAELLLAAAGGIVFVWATGAPATEDVPREITRATWTVPSDRQDTLSAQLGAECRQSLSELPVLVLGSQGDGEELEIATVPADRCASVRLVVPKEQLAADPTR